MERTKYRMYGCIPYNISEIAKGIQFGHSVVEYANKYFNDEDYQSWALNDKTFIILNGGTTNNDITSEWFGTLNQHKKALEDVGIKIAEFSEPDLGSQLTAICFLVEDKVYDKVKYPDYDYSVLTEFGVNGWIDSIGGHTNAWLRSYLKDFRLA